MLTIVFTVLFYYRSISVYLSIPSPAIEDGMAKLNCWQMLQCGRQPGGVKVTEWGVCPAAESGTHDGTHDGEFRGRVCWQVPGTFCDDNMQGDFAHKAVKCTHCDFFLAVEREEGGNFHLIP